MNDVWPSMVVHACNPSTLGGRGGQITWGQVFKTSLANRVKPISTKNTKISWPWWRTPVIPAAWEAEAGELLEPRRQRLQWADITPLHSSLGERTRLHLKIKLRSKVNHPTSQLKDLDIQEQRTLSKLCWMGVGWEGIFVLCQFLRGMLPAFVHSVWCWLWVCHMWLLLFWGMFLQYLVYWEFLTQMNVEFYPKLFLHPLR